MSQRIMVPSLTQRPTEEQLSALWGVCVQWIERYRPLGPESIYQTDRCSIAATELAEDVCDIVGYVSVEEA